MKDKITDKTKGLINRGNLSRVKKFLNRISDGEACVIAFIGGSITQGAVASTDELCYAKRVFDHISQLLPENQSHPESRLHPESHLTYINAGIGATTSQFGAARVYEDVLKYDPDLVFIEYSVNDNDEAPYERRELFRETYEGLIRKVLSYRSEPAVILLHSVRYDDGSSEEEMHSEVGRYYSLPSISMKQTIYPKTLSGEIKRADITPDNLHPNDVGHELTARVITDIIDLIDSEKDIEEEAYLLPERPLTDNGYEDMKRYNRLNSSPVLDGFIVDTAKQERVRDVFKNGWYSDRKGDSITFKIRGGEIGVMYKKTINKPAPVAIAILDGDETSPIILDANFDETWGDKAYMTTILHAGQDTEHTLKISIRDTFENMASAFYLINVIAGQLIPKG